MFERFGYDINVAFEYVKPKEEKRLNCLLLRQDDEEDMMMMRICKSSL